MLLIKDAVKKTMVVGDNPLVFELPFEPSTCKNLLGFNRDIVGLA
jgi:hypothetical protein